MVKKNYRIRGIATREIHKREQVNVLANSMAEARKIFAKLVEKEKKAERRSKFLRFKITKISLKHDKGKFKTIQ